MIAPRARTPQNLKGLYAELNKGECMMEVVIVSGDRNDAGFKKTMDGLPFVAVPFGDKRPALEAAVPCTGCTPPVPPIPRALPCSGVSPCQR